jgi:hypothetical protein
VGVRIDSRGVHPQRGCFHPPSGPRAQLPDHPCACRGRGPLRGGQVLFLQKNRPENRARTAQG